VSTPPLESGDSFFRALAETVADIVFTAAVDGAIDYVSTRWTTYTGQPSESALGAGYLDHVHPDDREGTLARWAHAREHGISSIGRARYRRADGAFRWQRVTAVPQRDSDGQIKRWIGTIADVTAERSAERSFRTLAETVPALVWSARPDGRVDYLNPRWQDRVGDIEDILAHGWREHIHPADVERQLQLDTQGIESGTEYTTRFRFRMRSGDYRWFESTAIPERDESGSIVRWYGACTDINESVVLREQLSDRDVVTGLLRELARRTPSLLLTFDPSGSIDFINERWSELIGVGAEAMLGFGYREFIHVDDLQAVRATLAMHLKTGKPYAGAWRLRRSDGVFRWVEIRAEAQRDEAGAIVRWYGAGIDIDTQRRAIDALELLAESGASIANANDVDVTVSRIARASLAGVADVSVFDLIEDDGSKRRVVVGAPSIAEHTLAMIRGFQNYNRESATPISEALRSRDVVHIPVVDEAYLAAHVRPESRRDAWRAVPVRSLIVAPLLVGNRTIGALTLVRSESDVPFDKRDVRVIEEIARRSAVAVDNIRLREYARREAAEKDERFHQIADVIPQLMWIMDDAGEMEWVNKRWLDYTGQASDEPLGNGWRAALHPDEYETVARTWDRGGRSSIFEMEFRIRDRYGIYRWFLCRAVSVETMDGTKWYGTNTDIDDSRRASRTLRVFADIGEALSESLGLQATLDAVMQVVVPDYADWAFINLADETEDLYIAAIYHTQAAESAKLATLVGKRYAKGSSTVGSPAAVRAREPLLYQYATHEDARRVVEPDVYDAFWDVGGYQSVLVVPLVVGALVRGTLTIVSLTSGFFTPVDVPFFCELGRRISPAIANAELYERERLVAQSFQTAALPRSLPEADGFVFSAIYEAGQAEALVGGDWYDAFKLLDGRIVVSIGDVQGSGLRAAVTMANIRQAIRGVAHVHADPELMLEAADRALRTENPDSFATAFVGVIDPIASTLTYKSAAHPPALVLQPSDNIDELKIGGLPLGLREPDREPPSLISLAPGSVLVLYTDGLTESTHDMLEGERRILAGLARTRNIDPEWRASSLYDMVLSDGSRDDVAIMTVSVGVRVQSRQWTIDALDQESTARARHEILAALHLAQRAPELFRAAELVLAEVVGNLARYAPGPAEMILEWDGQRPILHVRDNGPGFEYLPKLPPDPLSESGRGLFMVAALAADFNVTRRPEGGSHTRVVFET